MGNQYGRGLRARHDAHLGRGDGGESAFRADHHLGEIRRRVGDELVQVVTAHPAQQLRVALQHRVAVVLSDVQHVAIDTGFQGVLTDDLLNHRLLDRLEQRRAGIGKHDLELKHVVDRLAVENGSRPGRVVADHAADGGAAAGRGIGPEQKSVRPQVGIELVLHHARLHPRPMFLGVQFQHLVHVIGHVEDDRPAHGLAGERRAAAARQHRNAVLTGHSHRRLHVIGVPGYHHPERLDLVNAGVGAVQHAAEGVEAHLPVEVFLQVPA